MQLLCLIRSLDRTMVQPYLVLLDGEDEASRSLEPADCPVSRLGVQILLAPQAMRKLLEFRRFLMGKKSTCSGSTFRAAPTLDSCRFLRATRPERGLIGFPDPAQ